MNKFLILSTLVALVSAVSKDECHGAEKCLLTVEDQNISECMDKLSVKTVDCATYSCDNELSIKITEIKCKYEGQCVSDGVVRKNTTTCATFKCETSSNVVGDVTHYKSSMVIIKRECPNPRFLYEPDANDYFCIEAGRYRRDREICVQYDCLSMTDAAGTVTGMKVEASHYGCVNPRRGEPNQYMCINENVYRRTFSNCQKHTCIADEQEGKKILKLKTEVYGCLHNDTCVLDGAKIDGEQECTVKQCNVKQLNATHFSNSFDMAEIKCPHKDTCVSDGVKIDDEEKCTVLQCNAKQINATHYSNSFGTVEAKCRHGDTCVLDGAKIAGEKKCTVQQCNVKKVNGMFHTSFELVELKCEDMNGDCHGDQETLPYQIKDKVYNCKCNISFADKTISYTECRPMS